MFECVGRCFSLEKEVLDPEDPESPWWSDAPPDYVVARSGREARVLTETRLSRREGARL